MLSSTISRSSNGQPTQDSKRQERGAAQQRTETAGKMAAWEGAGLSPATDPEDAANSENDLSTSSPASAQLQTNTLRRAAAAKMQLRIS